jgi:hypothetical protein
VWAEFNVRLNDATGTLVHARAALPLHRDRITDNICKVGASPATPVELNSGPIPGHPDGVSFQTWEQTTLADVLGDRGAAWRQLGHQWIVFVFAIWEDELRGRLANALGVPRKDRNTVTHPILGDLRLIRNDVIHKRGVATQEHTGRCATLRWFSVGDDIVIENWMVVEVMDAFGLTRPAPEPDSPYIEVPPPMH